MVVRVRGCHHPCRLARFAGFHRKVPSGVTRLWVERHGSGTLGSGQRAIDSNPRCGRGTPRSSPSSVRYVSGASTTRMPSACGSPSRLANPRLPAGEKTSPPDRTPHPATGTVTASPVSLRRTRRVTRDITDPLAAGPLFLSIRGDLVRRVSHIMADASRIGSAGHTACGTHGLSHRSPWNVRHHRLEPPLRNPARARLYVVSPPLP